MTVLDQAQKDGVVIGLKETTGEVRNRLDIDTLLLEKPKTFNLFLLALEHLQDERISQKDKMGWFQIAGIHGLPKRDWDSVKVPGGQPGGYCPHHLPLFPTWHRPYLAMMEKTIFYTMLEIAKRFPDSKSQIEAVKEFRLPYWDYFRPRAGETEFPGVTDLKHGKARFPYDFRIPFILEVETVMVYRPEDEGELVETKNPLYCFEFPKTGGILNWEWNLLKTDDEKELDPEKAFKMRASRVRTVRRAATNKRRALNNQVSDYVELNSILSQVRESKADHMINMFWQKCYSSWEAFSYAGEKTGRVHGSIEGLHDAYHNVLGGEGHMSRIPVAAFDPIFWLHHCNIDRLIALWQAIHPKEFFSNKKTLENPLYPFRSPTNVNKHGFWTSADVKNVEALGYNYPEMQELNDPEALQIRVLETYGWASQSYQKQYPNIPADMQPRNVFQAQVFDYGDRTVESIFRYPKFHQLTPGMTLRQTPQHSASTKDASSIVPHIAPATQLGTSSFTRPVEVKEPALEHVAENGLKEGLTNSKDQELLSGKSDGTELLRQWFVDDLVKKSELNGAFTIYYFIGEFPADSNAYALAPTLTALTHIFTAPVEACDNCGRQAQQNLKVTSTNAITPMLLDYVKNGILGSLHPEDVVPFLRTNLHWRVVGINHQPKRSAEIPSLVVSVSSSLAYFLPDNPLPQEIGSQTYPEITTGRVGGLDA